MVLHGVGLCCAMALACATQFSTLDDVSGNFIFDDGSSSEEIGSSSEEIGSSSEEVGSFGDDSNSVLDNLLGFLDGLKNSGFDLSGDTVSGNLLEDPEDPDLSLDDSVYDNISIYGDNVSLFSSYDVYYGAISDTYLSYFRGFLPKLGFKDHYVVARTSQYDYLFAFGEDLVFDGSSVFSGDVTVIRINTDRYTTYSVFRDSSFRLNANSYLVYSDLGTVYPSLADSTAVSLRQILFLLVVFFLCLTMEHMYNVRHHRRSRNIVN